MVNAEMFPNDCKHEQLCKTTKFDIGDLFFYPDKISNMLRAIKVHGKSLFPLRPL